MSDLDLDALERLAAEATPGPYARIDKTWGVRGASGMVIGCETANGDCKRPRMADSAYIVAAMNALPILVAEVRRLRGEIAEIEEEAEQRRMDRNLRQ